MSAPPFDSLFSPSWYRVAALRPRLRRHLRIHQHTYRGQRWHVLQDPTTGRFHRFSPAAHHLIRGMDGSTSVDALWKAASDELGDALPTQDEVIQLLGQLHAADALVTDRRPDVDELDRRGRRQRGVRLKQRFGSPLAWRFRLIDPERGLARTLPWVQPLFGRLGFALWLGVVLSGAALAAVHWTELTHDVTDRVLGAENLLLLWISFPVVKALHELGHGFATKAWGGEVHEMGVMLLVLVPVPYVDASAATAFPERRRRMIVGAAGIMVELFLAGLALHVWVSVEPGAVRAVAYNVVLIASVSTFLFNGNPLLRYDGYYVLADWLEIPNLASRANRYLGYLVRRYAFGLRDTHSPVTAAGEPGWFFGYACASFAYRVAVIFAIALLVATRFFYLGVLVAAWAVYVLVARPLSRSVWNLMTDPNLRSARRRIRGVLLGAAGALVVLLGVVPAPDRTRAEGVILASERSAIRAGADGVVRDLLVEPGQRVEAGTALLACDDPELEAELRVIEARLGEARARYESELGSDRVQAEITRREVRQVEAQLARAGERVEALTVRSPVAGFVLLERPADLPGRFVARGQALGFVADFSDVEVRVLVEQDDADRVRGATRAVEVRLAEDLRRLPARIVREVPGATRELPSAALALAGGGRLGLDPEADEPVRTFRQLFQFELELDTATLPERLGERVFVRFDHPPLPLGLQWLRELRGLILRQLDV